MIATLCDIHGNLEALNAVLAEVPDEATIVVGGDIAAGGPNPTETLDRLRRLRGRVVWVRGNADRELTLGETGFSVPEAMAAIRQSMLAQDVRFLYKLPPFAQIGRVLYCHASPRNDVDVFTVRTSDDRIAPLIAHLDADVVICGHTHMQFSRSIAGKQVINAGSVGQPFEDQPGAYWMLDLEHRRTPYASAPQPALSGEGYLDWLHRVAEEAGFLV